MGLHINSLTYVIVVMAIGLLVDFLVHILLRYYETTGLTREEKVKETLRTMGASIFIGGATTFLSVCPLVLSTTHIFMTVFWAFLGIVVLGFTHGLILFPVVLSLIGPVRTHQQKGPPFQEELAKQPTGSSSESSTAKEETEIEAKDKAFQEIFQDEDEDEAEIKPASTEEELAALADRYKDPETKPVRFMGPSHDLERIEEGGPAGSHRHTPRNLAQVPSDEITHVDSRDDLGDREESSRNLKTLTTREASELPTAGMYCGAVDFRQFDVCNVHVMANNCKDTTEVVLSNVVPCCGEPVACHSSGIDELRHSRRHRRSPSPSRTGRNSRSQRG
jgi:hypothetical protein